MTQTKIVVIACSVFAVLFIIIVIIVFYLRWKDGNQPISLNFRPGPKQPRKSKPIPEARRDSKIHFVPPYIPSVNLSYSNGVYNFNKQMHHI